MKKCLNCSIYVGGNIKSCPLCRNSLTGEDSHSNWPSLIKLKKQAFLYKFQLFVVLTAIIVALGLDFLMDVNDGKHYSLIIAFGLITFELMIRNFLKKSIIVPKIISVSVLYVAFIMLITGWYYDFVDIVVVWIIPVLIIATLIADFVFSMIDKSENALVYLLVNILVAIVSYIVVVIKWNLKPFVWNLDLMIGVIALIGIIIFKGRKVKIEIEKRMNF